MSGFTYEYSFYLFFCFLQLQGLKSKSAEDIARLQRDIERGKEEAQQLVLKSEMGRLQAEEESKQQTLKLLEELEDMQKKQEVEVRVQGNFLHYKPCTC